MSTKLKKLCFEFLNMKPILPGTIKGQYSVCGQPNCRCADKENPQKHGPQNKLSFSLAGKSSTIFIRKTDVGVAQSMTENFARMRQLQTEILSESVRIYREEGAEVAEHNMRLATAHAQSKLTGVKIDTNKLSKLETSRNNWKEKAASRAVQTRKDTAKIKDLTASRDKWKNDAVSLAQEVESQKKEIEKLKHTCVEQSDKLSGLEMDLKKRGN